MSKISSPIELLEAIESLGLQNRSQTDSVRSEWTIGGPNAIQEASDQLVQRQLLTSFQAGRLLEGDGSSLVIAGRYRLRQMLGAGGMGAVYLATDTRLSRDVAIKVLPPRLVADVNAVARFEREAKALAHLTHANIVQAYDAGSDQERHYLAMEYVEGITLSQWIKERGPLNSALAADLLYQTALGLAHAHQKGIVHRDLKPANILITPAKQAKLLDLGLARFLQDQIEDDTLTIEGTTLGTPDYMAPEQFGAARNADERSDVYALGCTLYHALTGRPPFPGSSFSEKRDAHLKADAEPMPRIVEGIPAGLAQAVQKMMSKRPADRFQTAAACAEALLPYVDASSSSLPDLASTTGWQGGQFRVGGSAADRSRTLAWGAVVISLVLAALAVGLFIPTFWPPSRQAAKGRTETENKSKELEAQKDNGKQDNGYVDPVDKQVETPAKPPAVIDDDPLVLTVSKSGEDGGKYRTIGDALRNVKSGMTVRVLDGASYAERIVLRNRDQQTGITLEAVGGAKIVNDATATATIAIVGLPDVHIRGFHLQATNTGGGHIFVQGDCPGVVFEKMIFECVSTMNWTGFEIVTCNPRDRYEPPLVIQECEFRSLKAGIIVSGLDAPCRRIVIRNNLFFDMQFAGFQGVGRLIGVQIVANRFHRSGTSGVQLIVPSRGAERVLVANNTFLENVNSIHIDDMQVPEGDIAVHNNLLLSPVGSDVVFFKVDSLKDLGSEPGDVAGLAQAVKFTHNWRETKVITQQKAWVPPSPTDVRLDKIEGLSRDPKEAEFLRPRPASELATSGLGKTEAWLPRYIGALPPPGEPPWDWEKTWAHMVGESKTEAKIEEHDKD